MQLWRLNKASSAVDMLHTYSRYSKEKRTMKCWRSLFPAWNPPLQNLLQLLSHRWPVFSLTQLIGYVNHVPVNSWSIFHAPLCTIWSVGWGSAVVQVNIVACGRACAGFLCILQFPPTFVGHSKLPGGVNVSVSGCLSPCQPCDKLAACPGRTPPLHGSWYLMHAWFILAPSQVAWRQVPD